MLKRFRLKDLRISIKLILMVAAPVIVVSYFTVTSLISESAALNESSNIEEAVNLAVTIGNFVHESQKERGRTAGFVNSGGQTFVTELPAQRGDTDERAAELQEALAAFDLTPYPAEFSKRLDEGIAELNRIDSHRSQVDALSLATDDAIGYYTVMNEGFLDAIAFIPTLSSDGEIADLAAGYGVFLLGKEQAGIERARLSAAFASDQFGPGELVQAARTVQAHETLIEAFLEIVPEEQSDFYKATVQGEAVNEVDRMAQIAFSMGDVGGFGVNPDVWFNAITEKIDLLKQVEDELSSLLIDKADTLQGQAQTSLISLNIFRIGGISIALLLAVVVSRTITGQVSALSDLFGQVGEGDFAARGEVQSKDELGQMTDGLNTMLDAILKQVDALTELFGEIGIGNFEARVEVMSDDPIGQMAAALNSMLDNTLALIQSADERDKIQTAVQKLLEEVSGVAEGDLTVEAEVTEDITGAIADSFNFMIVQLREIISNVQDATLQVSSSANEIQTTAEHLSTGSEQQSAQIAESSAAVEEMAVSIQQVSENAKTSATVGEQALSNAQQGTIAVRNTVDGMNRIRDQVQETSKRIKRLGESSQEIGEIVQLIGDIADRTSILALNASIQAAMAGEAGRGFAVVAEEVEQLAERSTEATKQIETLIRNIQNETTEAVAAMESTTNEVVEGSSLADEAGAALTEIEGVSTQLAELSTSISQASQQQARGSESIAKAMGDISEVTQQTASGTKQAAVSINTLASLADDLRASVSAFKLPGTNGREPARVAAAAEGEGESEA